MKINKVVVIGSGTMGSGIAAQLCNANVPVTLLDLTTEISEKARERILKSRPPLLIDKSKINNINVGNINDNFNEVGEADWIVEAVVERIDIKHNIYEKIFKERKKGSIVSSNTSSIPIKVLSEKLSDEEKKDFCITHFFNPVRYMDLLEIVKNENNDLDQINSLKSFCEKDLGKGALICNDTPGFLGNRIGVYAMQVAMTEAFKMKLTIEEADAVFGRPMGIPKTGVFGLYDLIGIDLMADVLKSFIKELPETDDFQVVAKEIPLVKKLIETGYTGRKGKGGFYRMNKSDNKKILEGINLETGEYSLSKKFNLGSEKMDIVGLINRKDKYGEYAWSVISKIIKYASSLVPGITDKFNDIDEAMRLGFNWSKGPFEMLKEIGVKDFFERIDTFENNKFLENLSQSKDENFYGERQQYTDLETLGKIKPRATKLDKNNSAETYRFDDFNIVEFTTKANALDYDSMDSLKNATDKPLIIINESMQFSAGVNLTYTMNFADKGDFKSIEKFVKYFQETCKELKYSKYPVVSAPSGLTLITQTLNKDWKIKKSSFHAFEECSGWLNRLNDCFAQKGFQEIALVSTSGHDLLLINTHLDAGRSQWDREARKKQLEQLAFAIEKAVRKEAIIVGGDFNLDWDDKEDKKLIYSFLDRLKLTLAVRGGASNKRWRTLDYIFFRSGLNAQLRVADSGEDLSFSPDSQPLSDHPAIYANFSVR